MDRDSLRSGGVGRRSGSQSRGSMQQRKPLSIPASSATDTPTTGSAFDLCALDAQSALYESIDDDDIVYDQGFPMSSRRQAVDKLDRTITRLYTYLSGSEEGEDANDVASSTANHQASPSHPMQQQPQRGRRSQQQQQQPPQPPQRGSNNNNNNFQQHHHHHLHHQEPEYQQPYAYPPAHAHPFNPSSQQHFGGGGGPLAGAGNSLGGSTPTSNNSSDHASEITFTESELALTHQGTLPISGNVGLLVLDDEDEEDHDLDDHIAGQHQQQQQYQTPPSRGTNSSSMGRLNGRQMGHASSTGMTTLVSSSSSSSGSTYPHRGGMMMAQHVPHYQLPPTPPHHPIHAHLSGYVVQHPHHVANNSFSTKDVMDNEMDSDPTTLLKQAPSSSKFIPADLPKSSTLDYKHNLAGSPTKSNNDMKQQQLQQQQQQQQPDRCLLRMSGVRPQSSLFSPTSPHSRNVMGGVGGLRKSLSFSSRCSWKCTAILLMLTSAVLAAAVAYLTAAHFVNWPPQPAKSHAVMVDGGADGNGYVTTVVDGVNGSLATSGNIIANHGGNNALASILVRLSEQEQSQLVRLARRVAFNQRRRPRRSANVPTLPTTTTTTTAVQFPPLSYPALPLRVVHGRRAKRNVPATTVGQRKEGRRQEDDRNDDDDAIWEMLRDWIAQEQRMMAADQPPSERPQRNEETSEAGSDNVEPFESSGDMKELAIVSKEKKQLGKVVGSEPSGKEKKVDAATTLDEGRPVDDWVVPSEMAAAESLILLLPTATPSPPRPAVGSIFARDATQRPNQPTSITSRLGLDSSFNRTQSTAVGDGHLLLVAERGEGEDEDTSTEEFAYDDHVVEIVQLDRLGDAVIPVPAPQLRHEDKEEEEELTAAARQQPLMNKTRCNSTAVVDVVVADSPSHPSNGGDNELKLELELELELEHLAASPLPTDDGVSTMQPQNDDVARLGSVEAGGGPTTASTQAASSASDFVGTLEIGRRLNANVSQSMPSLLNITNDTLPPDADETEPDASVNERTTWPLVIVPLASPLAVADDANGLAVDSSSSSSSSPSSQPILSVSLAGNISEELLSPWAPPDVISYRGPVVVVQQSAVLTPDESTTTTTIDNAAGCDCQCPSYTLSPDDVVPTDAPTTSLFITRSIPEPEPVPVPLSCPPPPACIMTEALTSTTTTTTAPKPIVPTEATTTPTTTTTIATTPTTTQMIPPILILEGSNTFPARSFPPDGTTFAQVTLGDKISNVIPPYSYWNMQFYHSEAAYVRFELGLPRSASLGLYGRRNALPTHTHYDMLHIVSGYKSRARRASTSLVQKEVLHYMEPGHWFVSLYNDDGDPQEATCLISLARDMTLSCPRGCNGNGECILGRCQCKSGFGGDDCSESVCPVLCSGRGDYINGQCQCNPGWKGGECSLKHDECEVPDCSGHGKCSGGKCLCGRGFKGEFCDIVDCPHPTCSDHGFCVDGTCLCKKGWKGPDCALVDSDAMQCLPDCSGAQGTFSLELHKCVCASGWTGDDCSKSACGINCGGHGRCEASACVCDAGWTGEFCQERLCDSRCNEHGQCKNGTCLCVTGWNGKHCTLEGCPRDCSKRGQCKSSEGSGWSCRCDKGWEGPDCSIPLELECDDGKDNDKDGLLDCEDSDCCATRHCKKSPFCVTAPKPIDILLRKQPPAVTASFYERMKFLIEEGSLQSYAKQDAFNESRSAVVRGKVVAASGLGLFGVRVSSSNPLEGFTLTRDDGWFDLMVNGGGSVVIHFGRTPFRPTSRTVNVPWNEVIILDVVTMKTEDVLAAPAVSVLCEAHDYDAMRPVVLATWKHGFQGSCPAQSAILAESQVVQESLEVPGTGAHLVYHSSRSAGYLSTIQLQLTPDVIPPSLSRIHLKITIEGVLFEKLFEADPGIKYTYAWNRFNVYRQRVYGVTTATVKVGYEYTTCPDVLWEVQTTKLSGHDMSISDIGGWNLDIHHRYNFHEGILQKGDGSNMYLRYRPEVLRTVMGDGHQRPLECSSNACEGPAVKQRVLAPVALTASPDGSIYVGDFNLIRRIGTDGNVKTLLRLNATRVSYRYHMALSPVDNVLYLSDPEAHQIIRVRNMNDYNDPERNWEPIIGSGERCLPGDEFNCGDGGLAREAKLAYPKGVAVAADGTVYFADGTNIRAVDKDGLISTIVGNHQHRTHWNPMPCEGTLPLGEVRLRWPTEIAINPLDGALHIIDDHMIVRLTSDGRMKIVAGKPLHCPASPTTDSVDLATQAGLVMPQSLAFGPNGDLYVAESDSQRINRVRRIGTDGRIITVAGAESKCNCLDSGCNCYDEERHLATASRFNTISAIAVSPDGVLHICDQANYRLRAVTSSLPVETAASSTTSFDIYSPETQEIYVFNRFGQHVATKSMVTGRNVYLFGYNVNTSNGKVSTVTDSAGNKIFLLRDYSNQVTSIENTRGHKCRLRMSRTRLLQEFSTPEGRNVTFDYHGSTGLLKSRVDSGRGQGVSYQYDDNGRLISAISPTGEIVKLTFDLSLKGASVQVVHGNRSPVVYFIKPGWSVSKKIGQAEEVVSMQPDRSVVILTPFGHLTATETSPYGAVLGESDSSLAETFPVPAKQKVEIGGELVSRLEWRYFVRRRRAEKKDFVQLGKRMRVNGENLLTVEYDKESQSEAVFMEDRAVELLNITYDDMSRPISWTPGRSSSFAGVEVSYDRFGQLAVWRQGDLSESYNYDRSGRLAEVVFADGSKLTYSFRDAFATLPSQLTTERGHTFLLHHNNIGALQSVTTPRGHIHSLGLQMVPGGTKFLYHSPASRQPFQLLLDDQGRLQSKLYPAGARIVYIYDDESRLAKMISGVAETSLDYYGETGLLKTAEVKERPGYEVRSEFKYHGGLVKEERTKFGSKTGLDNARTRCKYDGNGRLALIETELNGRELPPHAFSYNQNLGLLEGVNDLRVYRNAFNRTVIQDSTKHYFRISDRDQHGRTAMALINIKGYDAFKFELDFDVRGRVRHRRVTVGQKLSSYNVTYNAEGGLLQVQHQSQSQGFSSAAAAAASSAVGAGGRSYTYTYTYDDNGNILTMSNGEQAKMSLVYDAGDRVSSFGEGQTVTYDARGFVVRRGALKLAYNDRGQLSYASSDAGSSKFRVWYNYDYRGRLSVWRDDKGNVTQFFYTNPLKPHLLTLLHWPKESRTLRMYYDVSDHLIAVESPEQRWYVASDETGAPLVVFNVHGSVIKLMERTPFGSTVLDTEPGVYIGVDFRGGILSPHTGMVHFGGRVYDPSIAQWLTPEWEHLVSRLTNPQDIFVYRFHGNDPISVERETRYMTSLDDWLQLFGYSWNNIVGAEYSTAAAFNRVSEMDTKNAVGHFGVISGLRCLTENVQNGFSVLSFVPPPKLRSGGELRRNPLPGIAYRKPALGEGILLSRAGGRVAVTLLPDSQGTSGGILQDVLGSVLGDSSTTHWLDIRTGTGQQEIFYFVKESLAKLRDDQEDLKRLSGQFNITLVENPAEQGGGSELRLANADLSVSISYGVEVDAARQRILRMSHRRAVEAAWLREKQLVESGLPGQQVDWSVEERVELMTSGRVDGFVGSDLHSIYDYPQLADDASNIIFRRDDTKRKRRKSHRLSARQQRRGLSQH